MPHELIVQFPPVRMAVTRVKIKPEICNMDESEFDYNYVPEHLAEKVRNSRSLSFSERWQLTCELSKSAWAKIGVVCDPSKPMNKTMRRVNDPWKS